VIVDPDFTAITMNDYPLASNVIHILPGVVGPGLRFDAEHG